MKHNKVAQIISLVPQFNSLNEKIAETETITYKFDAEIQPYSSKSAEEQYGTTTKVTDRLFCNPNPYLKLGSFIRCGKKYRVNELKDFGKHFEVLLEVIEE